MIEKKSSEIILIIITLILTTISIHSRLNTFLDAATLKVIFDIDRNFFKEFVIIEKINAKVIFKRYVGIHWDDYCKFESVCIANYKDNKIKAEKKNPKDKAKRFKNEK